MDVHPRRYALSKGELAVDVLRAIDDVRLFSAKMCRFHVFAFSATSVHGVALCAGASVYFKCVSTRTGYDPIASSLRPSPP